MRELVRECNVDVRFIIHAALISAMRLTSAAILLCVRSFILSRPMITSFWGVPESLLIVSSSFNAAAITKLVGDNVEQVAVA